MRGLSLQPIRHPKRTKEKLPGLAGSQEKEKMKFPSFRLSSEIEKTTDLRKVLEERILDNRVELSLREVLGIAKKKFHDSIIDIVKRKWLSAELESEKLATLDKGNNGDSGPDRRHEGVDCGIDRKRIRDHFDVNGLL